MSALNHLGVYLMLVYVTYLVYMGICIYKDREAFEDVIECFIGFITAAIILVLLEIPYWIIYLCFIKYG